MLAANGKSLHNYVAQYDTIVGIKFQLQRLHWLLYIIARCS